MNRLIFAAVAVALLGACSNSVEDLKSPCVGAEGSPCDHRPVNDWWQNPQRG